LSVSIAAHVALKLPICADKNGEEGPEKWQATVERQHFSIIVDANVKRNLSSLDQGIEISTDASEHNIITLRATRSCSICFQKRLGWDSAVGTYRHKVYR
jgi:hypothetical protein